MPRGAHGVLVAGFLLDIFFGACPCTRPTQEPEPFTDEDVAEVCLKLDTCLHRDLVYGFWGVELNECVSLPYPVQRFPPLPHHIDAPDPVLVTGMERWLRVFYDCVRQSEDCDGVTRCLDQAKKGPSQCLSKGIENAQCDGSVVVGCSEEGDPFSVDCAEYGLTCGRTLMFLTEVETCVLAECPVAGDRQCQGSLAPICPFGEDRNLSLVDCARLDQTCVEGREGARCVGTGPCPESEPATCASSTRVACEDSEVGWVRYRCSLDRTFRRCERGRCVATGTECDIDEKPTCEGNSVRICQDGFVRTVPCAVTGRPRCEAGRCVP